MNKINLYLFKNSSKYILINIMIITILIIFINLLEISRLLAYKESGLYLFIYLVLLKIPSIIGQTIPFVIIISIAFLFRSLVTNNELISIRNIGMSILDVYKPIAFSIFLFGSINLFIINPVAAKFENQYESLTSKDLSSVYSIKFIGNGIWIKNISDKNEKKIHLILLHQNFRSYGLQLLNQLRKNNIAVYFDYKYDLKKSLSKANKLNSEFAIIIGEEEFKKNQYIIKYLHKNTQETVSITEIVNILK